MTTKTLKVLNFLGILFITTFNKMFYIGVYDDLMIRWIASKELFLSLVTC